jgi:hypothetical protein
MLKFSMAFLCPSEDLTFGRGKELRGEKKGRKVEGLKFSMTFLCPSGVLTFGGGEELRGEKRKEGHPPNFSE